MNLALMNKALHIFYAYFNYLFALLIAGMYANALIFPNMGVDASFYLRVTECIADGAIPEHDLRILYPPMIFYMLLPIKLIVGKSIAYELFLGYMFLVQFLNAFLIYKIASSYTHDRFIRIFTGLLYLFLSIKLEGEYFFLEPFINLWGLLAIWVYLKKVKKYKIYFLFSGILAFLAFLTKQYGLAYAGAIYVLILIDERRSLKIWFLNSLLFSFGLLGGLLLFTLVFRLGYGVYYDFFAGGRLGIYGERDLTNMLWGMFEYAKIAPWLVLLLFFPIRIRLLKTNPHFFAYIVLVVLFSLQLYFQQYEHYYMLMLPGLLLFGIMIFDQILQGNQNRIILTVVIALSLFINEFLISPRTKSLLFSTNTTLAEEVCVAIKINEVIPEGSSVYLFTNVKFYYLCHFEPAIPEKYGFAWNHTTSRSDLYEILDFVKYTITSQNKLNDEFELIDGSIVNAQTLDQYCFELITQVDDYIIFGKKK